MTGKTEKVTESVVRTSRHHMTVGQLTGRKPEASCARKVGRAAMGVAAAAAAVEVRQQGKASALSYVPVLPSSRTRTPSRVFPRSNPSKASQRECTDI